MEYKTNAPISPKALSDLRESVGWNRMEKEYASPLMTNYCHIAAYDSGRLVGYVAAVSNAVTDAYIQDLMVRPSHQKKEIGTELMSRMIKHLKDKHIYMISVIYEESLKPFYEKFGFIGMLSGQLETYREGE